MAKRRIPKHSSPKGYDFGLAGLTALVGSPQFIEDLRTADVVACAYGWEYSSLLQQDVPVISLGGTNEASIKRVFDEFHRWQEESHDEGVSLTIVFLNSGGYVIGLSPHSESLSRRLGRSSSPSDRFFVAPMFFKQFDTRDRWLDYFREYRRERVIAPFHFGPVVVSLDGPRSINKSTVRRPGGSRIMLKFDVEITDEAEARSKPGSKAWIALNAFNKGRLKQDRLPRSPRTDTSERREQLLRRHFPVTTERVRVLEPYRQMAANFECRGVRHWQVRQAVCNLILSKSICNGRYHYASLRTGHLSSAIADALHRRCEEADGKPLFTPEILYDDIELQVRLDAAVLLKSQDITVAPGDALDRVLSTLESKGLLDA